MNRARAILSRTLAALGAASLLLAGFVAVAPDLHEWLHAAACPHGDGHEAGEPEHECAATLLAHGLVESCAAPPPFLPQVGAACDVARLPASVLRLLPPHSFPPGRAPPAPPVSPWLQA